MGKPYTPEQEAELLSIARKPKIQWPDLIKPFAEVHERQYGSVWQKVYTMAGGPKTKGQPTKGRPGKKKTEKRKGKVRREPVKKGSKRKSHKSPLDSYMTVSPNEVRFPISSIRIEGGELIVTFK